jgi:hypothetical protein
MLMQVVQCSNHSALTEGLNDESHYLCLGINFILTFLALTFHCECHADDLYECSVEMYMATGADIILPACQFVFRMSVGLKSPPISLYSIFA